LGVGNGLSSRAFVEALGAKNFERLAALLDPRIEFGGRRRRPFMSRKLALEWLEQEGLGSTPSDTAMWAAVYPVSDEEVV